MASTFEALLLAQVGYVAHTSPFLITNTVLGANTASVTLTVPSTAVYNTLRVTWRARADNAVVSQLMNMRINGVTTSSYLTQKMEANNGTQSDAITLTTSFQIGNLPGASATAGYVGGGRVELYDVQDTTNNLATLATSMCWTGSANAFAGTYGGNLVSFASPVSTITLLPAAGNLVSGSMFSLYGEY